MLQHGCDTFATEWLALPVTIMGLAASGRALPCTALQVSDKKSVEQR